MQASNSYFDTISEDQDHDTQHENPEDLADRFGMKMSLLILCIGLFIAAVGVATRPSFEKCSALENITERNACYGELRKELFNPPAKGADSRTGQ